MTRYGPMVLRVCRAVVGPDAADDAWSETFLSAHAGLPAVAPGQRRPGLAGHHRAPQGDRPDPGGGPASAPDRRPRPSAPTARSRPRGSPACGRPCSSCRPSSGSASPTTTSWGCPTPRSPRSSAGRRTRPVAPRRTASQRCARPLQHRRSEHEHPRRRTTCSRPCRADDDADAAPAARAAGRRAPTPTACWTSPTGRWTPRSASLLLAATERGLVKVSFEREGHEQVLEQLARRGQPAHPARARAGWTRWRASSTSTSPDAAASSTCRSTCSWPTASGAPSSSTCATSGTATPTATRTVAAAVGSPRAVRAVGTACATNPLPLVLPCHRVVRSDGSLGQYGGGEQAKRWLIDAGARALTQRVRAATRAG